MLLLNYTLRARQPSVVGVRFYMELKLTSPKYGEKIVLIDDEDYERIKTLNWTISFVRGNWYAVHSFYENGKHKQIKMHRFIMNETNPNIKIDHRNNCGIDNRKQNLRRATTAENTRNTGPNKLNRTGYKGVYKYTSGANSGRFTACLKVNGEKIHGGYFNSAIEAAEKYNELALTYHKDFAFINNIDPNELLEAKSVPKQKKLRTPKDQKSLKCGYYGVTLAKGNRKRPYRVMLDTKGNSLTIGYFETVIEAAKAYNNALIKHGGDLRKLNKIPE